MAIHRFIVEIDTDNVSDAETVMTERIGYDEDYGFDYTIDWFSEDAARGK